MNELNLLRGQPNVLDCGISVYPLKLNDVADLGEEKYNLYLSCLSLSKKQIDITKLNKDEIEELKELSDFNFMLSLIQYDENIQLQIEGALSIFLKSNVVYEVDVGLLILNNDNPTLITDSIFNEIRNTVFLQNYIKNKDEEQSFNPANEKAKQLKEKMDKMKKKIKEVNKEEGLSLKDIISIVATYSNDINLITVWELTVYQLYEAYLRLIMWDNYHTNFTLLPHIGGKDLDMKHWSSRLEI